MVDSLNFLIQNVTDNLVVKNLIYLLDKLKMWVVIYHNMCHHYHNLVKQFLLQSMTKHCKRENVYIYTGDQIPYKNSPDNR